MNLLIAIFSLVIIAVSGMLMHSLEKYEFENRTDGGVVQFKSYEKSLGHNFTKTVASILMAVGGLALFFSALSLWNDGISWF